LIIAGVYKDESTIEMIVYCNSIGIWAVDASVDLLLPGNSNRPYDEHPSPKAHKIYADKIGKLLSDSVFVIQ
jgi:dTDP-4-dehydrorhamnose reductase